MSKHIIIGYIKGRPIYQIAGGAPDPADPPPPPPAFTPPATQAELDRIITERLGREKAKFADYDQVKEKAARLDTLEEQNKTELQKAQDALAAAQKAAADATAVANKATVAASKGVPMNLLTGTTEAELTASADALLAFRGTATTPTTPPPLITGAVPGLTPGMGGKAEKSVSAGADMFAARKKPTTTTN